MRITVWSRKHWIISLRPLPQQMAKVRPPLPGFTTTYSRTPSNTSKHVKMPTNVFVLYWGNSGGYPVLIDQPSLYRGSAWDILKHLWPDPDSSSAGLTAFIAPLHVQETICTSERLLDVCRSLRATAVRDGTPSPEQKLRLLIFDHL